MSVEVNLNVGARCPICERGRLALVAAHVWQCTRNRCNNEFYLDEGELNVRDKPKWQERSRKDYSDLRRANDAPLISERAWWIIAGTLALACLVLFVIVPGARLIFS